MGAEVLVAGLWVAVLVYWLWTRRPTTSDTVGLFRHELHVLRYAAPTKVAPANRMQAWPDTAVPRTSRPRPVLAPVAATPLAAAAASYKRAEMRRRRRDILTVLGATTLVSFLGAVLTRSGFVIALQALCDLALAGYLWLLVQSGRSRLPAARSGYPGAVRSEQADSPLWPQPRIRQAARPLPGPAGYPAARLDRSFGEAVLVAPVFATVPGYGEPPDGYGADADGYGARAHDHGAADGQAYGDFDSYASLALAQAN